MARHAYLPDDERGVDINLSPLIDVVFLLLIFFLVTAVFVDETGVEIEKPRAISARQAERNSLQLAITAEGRILHAGRSLPLSSVRGVVRRTVREHPVPVLIEADRRSPSGLLIEVYDECKRAGAAQVLVATARETGS